MKSTIWNMSPQPSEPIENNQEPGTRQNEKNMLVTAKGGSVLMFGRLVTYVARFAIALVIARIMGAEN